MSDSSPIDVEHMLEALELENIERGFTEIRFSCPFPNHEHGDKNASAYMNIETAVFFCHGCKEKGDASYFVSRVLGISRLEAARMLREAYHEGYIDPDARATEEEVRRVFKKESADPQPVLPENVLDRFYKWDSQARRYMLDRGFDQRTLDEWQIGWDPHSDRVTIPVRDISGRLVGFKARVHDDRQPKYLILGDREGRPAHYRFPCYKHSEVIFGLHQAILLEDPHGEDMPRSFVVCEGELNAIACWQAGFAAIAINGSHFTETQAYLLAQEADHITVCFDSDEAGLNATWGWTDAKQRRHPGIVEVMKPFIAVSVVDEHEGDPASMSESEIYELISRAKGASLAQIS